MLLRQANAFSAASLAFVDAPGDAAAWCGVRQESGKHIGRTAAREATAAAGGMVVLTRGGRRGMPASALLRLALPLTLDVSVCAAVVFDQAPFNTVHDPVPCQAKVASEEISRGHAIACKAACQCAGR